MQDLLVMCAFVLIVGMQTILSSGMGVKSFLTLSLSLTLAQIPAQMLAAPSPTRRG